MIFTLNIKGMKCELEESKDGWKIGEKHCSKNGEEYLIQLLSDACPYHVEDLMKGFWSQCWKNAHKGLKSEREIQVEIDNFMKKAEIQQ